MSFTRPGAEPRDRLHPLVHSVAPVVSGAPQPASPLFAPRGAARQARPIYATNGFNPPRPVLDAMHHGWGGHCPCCGKGALFSTYLDLNEDCPACGEALHPARVGNAAPLIAIPVAVAAACLVGGVLEIIGGMALWAELLLCEGLGLVTALWVLPRAKGMLVGYAWACHLGGFDPLRHLVPDPEGDARAPGPAVVAQVAPPSG